MQDAHTWRTRATRVTRGSPAFLAALVVATCLAACGARSGLEDRAPNGSDAGPTETPRNIPEPTPLPAWSEGVWWFSTIRAVCDTFAVEFCGGGRVAARWSRDDRCLGDNPTTLAPLRGRVAAADGDTVELAFDVPEGGPEPAQVRLRAATDPPVRALELEPGEGFIEFPWGEGRRPEELDVPAATVSAFVFCD